MDIYLHYQYYLKAKTKTNDVNFINTVSNEVESEYLTENSSVIVTLLGNEYSPENLAEIGISLSIDKKIKVINITEASLRSNFSRSI